MKNKDLLDSIKSRVLLCDGAMGTMLQAEGLAAGECPELWNLTKPESVTGIHKKYIEAGADMVLSNTFGANRLKLEKFNLDGKLREINEAGVKNAKTAAGNSPARRSRRAKSTPGCIRNTRKRWKSSEWPRPTPTTSPGPRATC